MIIRFIKSLIKFALYIVFVAAAVYFTPIILSRVLDTPYPLATITSGSMWPVLQENDLVLMRGAKGSDVKIGEIIIFENQKGFTIHRLIRKEKDPSAPLGTSKLVTKGDANNVEDQPIEESAVIGRIIYFRDKPLRFPKLGFIARHIGPQIQNLTN